MEFYKIELKNRELVENIRKKFKNTLFSHSFYTIYFWKDIMKLTLYLEEDFFVVKYEEKGTNSYFFPCGNICKTEKFIKDNIGKKDFQLFYLRDCDKRFIEQKFADFIQINEARGSWEYIFSREEHALLSGKKYAKIRNEENCLRANHILNSSVLSLENIKDAYAILDEWENRRKMCHIRENDDYGAAFCALQNYMQQGMIGIIVYVDGKPQGIAIGCEITQDTFGVQAAKIIHGQKGLIFYVLHELFKVLPPQYEFINGDDDLNIEGLRIHKRKMQPCGMNKVWEGIVKQ